MSGETTSGRHWAARSAFGRETNRLTAAVTEVRAAMRPLVDLTVSNPTRCGLSHEGAAILSSLAVPESLRYDADPLGAVSARAAIAGQYYGERGVSVTPEQMLLTSSTSEGYGFLLRLLCDAGDEILVPEPSYPLFDMLAQVQDVSLIRYPLRLHDGWRVNWAALRERVTPRTRAIVVVHPNNPTGHAVDAAERAAFEAVALQHGLALIVDEVFLDYPVEAAVPFASFAGPLPGSDARAAAATPVLTFVLSGLSKVLALPQMKLGWVVARGPDAEVQEAVHRLGFIADTFLSVNGPVQGALSAWMPMATGIQEGIRTRLRTNLAALDECLAGSLCSRLRVEAGWCAVLRVPAIMPDEELAALLVREAGVLVHPGSFYGMAARGWLVVSLLCPLEAFRAGVLLLSQAVERIVTGEPKA